MIINHNMNAMNSHRQMVGNTSNAGKSMEKLSSGLRINRAGDDAAGLAISEKMRGQIRGLDQASRNSQDGISMIQTAEGALNETHSILQRMRELSVQAATDTNTAEDRTNVQDEMNQLTKEIDRISSTTEFNTKKLLDGSMGSAVATAVANIGINTQLKGAAGVALTSATTLVTAENAAGQGLGVVSGDTVDISYVVNGTQKTVTVAVTASVDMSELANAADFTATVSTGAAGEATGNFKIVATNAGFTGGIYGLTMTVKDSKGNVKTAATNSLSAFTETTRAQDKRLDGSSTLHIGANAGQSLSLDIENMSSSALGVSNLKVGTQSQANSAIKVIGEALKKVSTERSKLGATQNRLEHTIANLNTSSENLQASESRIRDVDMAKEMMNFSKNNILTQASQAMLAQAKSQPEQVLQLLR